MLVNIRKEKAHVTKYIMYQNIREPVCFVWLSSYKVED